MFLKTCSARGAPCGAACGCAGCCGVTCCCCAASVAASARPIARVKTYFEISWSRGCTKSPPTQNEMFDAIYHTARSKPSVLQPGYQTDGAFGTLRDCAP